MSKLEQNTTDLRTVLAKVNALPDAGSSDGGSGGGVELPTLTNPGDASKMLEGYELIDGSGQIVTGNIPAVKQAEPTIFFDGNSGLITAVSNQFAGYVAAGTKSDSEQLTTQSGKTVTPGTSNQTAVSSGVFVTGNVIVAGDSNLKPANIVKGVSIFGVAGSYVGVPEGTLGFCDVVIRGYRRYDGKGYFHKAIATILNADGTIGAEYDSIGLVADSDLEISNVLLGSVLAYCHEMPPEGFNISGDAEVVTSDTTDLTWFIRINGPDPNTGKVEIIPQFSD